MPLHLCASTLGPRCPQWTASFPVTLSIPPQGLGTSWYPLWPTTAKETYEAKFSSSSAQPHTTTTFVLVWLPPYWESLEVALPEFQMARKETSALTSTYLPCWPHSKVWPTTDTHFQACFPPPPSHPLTTALLQQERQSSRIIYTTSHAIPTTLRFTGDQLLLYSTISFPGQ